MDVSTQSSPLRREPIVRFAPSPTGHLHLGGARTALYNFLYAKQRGGTFLLRFEDTDAARSKKEYLSAILEDLTWLGLIWDGEPIVQSQRMERYREALKELEKKGKVYPCFCTKEELAAEKERAQAAQTPYRYSRKCLQYSLEERKRRKETEPYLFRLLSPREPVHFHDLVRGEITFPETACDDLILMRSDGTPIYHLTVVIDDLDFGITHIIRGEDHLSNTPKQIQIIQALGASPPAYAHIPLIVGPRGERLSKRLGSLSVRHFKERGFLREALLNFIARLGFSYDDRQEVFTLPDLIQKFSLEKVSASKAALNEEKLFFFQREHLARLDDAELVERLLQELGESFAPLFQQRNAHHLLQRLRPRLRTLQDAKLYLNPLLHPPQVKGAPEDLPKIEELQKLIQSIEPFEVSSIVEAFGQYAERHPTSKRMAALYSPLRLWLTGERATLPMPDLLYLLGKEEVLARLEAAARSTV